METKTCYRCKQTKTLENFRIHPTKNRQAYCIQCNKEYHQSHYQQNKSKYIEDTRLRKKEKIKRWRAFKATLNCVKCGENHPACLDFHHINGKKDFNIGHKLTWYGWARLMKEVAKCEVLCSNCHRKEHYGS